MACLAECTDLWPDGRREPCGADSKDDGDRECKRDPWRERHPVEAWQPEQVVDGGHENKPPCSVLPASSSKDPSEQVQRHAWGGIACERCRSHGVCWLARGGRELRSRWYCPITARRKWAQVISFVRSPMWRVCFFCRFSDSSPG